jgi:nudix-type nucleoside diphosphatase (YffH/AdpP family)
MKSSRIRNIEIENLSNQWYVLDKVSFEFKTKNGEWQKQVRESYNRGDGAAILLINTEEQKVVLTRQFRMPSYLNGNESGMMIEVCAGLLDKNDPITCIKNEVLEETGYKVDQVKKVFELYSTPGAVTEKIHYFIAEYNRSMKVNAGGGLENETEEIEVLELNFKEVLALISAGKIKDAKTVILLQYAMINKLI